MIKMNVEKIDLRGFEKQYRQFTEAIDQELVVALVRTREDFLRRIADVLGSVGSGGGNNYFGVYWAALSKEWLTVKSKFSYMMPIGTASGDLKRWMMNLATNPHEVIRTGQSIEISAGPDGATGEIARKIYGFETGDMWGNASVPARPIFHPAVAWYDGLGANSPFYHECVAARNRAIVRIYGA